MNRVARWLSIIGLAIRRLWNRRGLMACIAVGFTTAVSLVMSVPMYADAVGYTILSDSLSRDPSRPPFSFLHRYVGSWSGPIEWKDYAPADDYMTHQAPETIGLPIRLLVRHVRTDNLRLFAASEESYSDTRKPLEWINVGFMDSLRDHIDILEGRFPNEAAVQDSRFEVLIHENLANSLGLQAGEEYILYGGQRKGGYQPATLTAYIAGVWRPINRHDPYWFYQADSLRSTFLLPEVSFVNQITTKLANEVNLAVWYAVYAETEFHTEDVAPFLMRVNQVNRRATNLLGDISLDISPVEALQSYQSTTYLLTILLLVFAIPIVVIVLYFVALVSDLVVQEQRTEMAVLRSRGTSSPQIVWLHALEALLLGGIALGVGPFIAKVLTQIMGNTRTFLSFVPSPALPMTLSGASVQAGVGAVALAVATTLVPAVSAASDTIVTHKQELARSLRRPFWQRYLVDFWILVPVLYGYYLLRQRGTISVLGRDLTPSSDPFGNPLLFLVPTLFLLAMSLVCIRLFPLVIGALGRISRWLPGSAAFLALNQLSRATRQYTGPLLLVILTVSLAAFTASMAKTLDGHLTDRAYYQVGADIHLVETGESPEPTLRDAQVPGEQAEEDSEATRLRWLFLPVSEHLGIPGVTGATRVGNYAATPVGGETRVEGRFLGIDRVDWPSVGFFRRDFGEASLGALMNQLALRSQGLLVSRQLLVDRGLDPGDTLRLEILAYGESREVVFTVAEAIDYFPTVYPEDGPLFVGNLDYLFQEMGGQYPYDVWLNTDGRDSGQVIKGVEELGLRVLSREDARELVRQAKAQPGQRGSFGLLSIGFIAAAALTVVGFLLHTAVRFRERFIELGVLRSIGLSRGQMASFLASEQLLLIVSGVGLGTGLGVWASYLFVPFFQIRGGPHAQTPTFVIQIAWDDIYKIYAIMGAMLAVAILLTIRPLMRMKIFEAIKLGETA